MPTIAELTIKVNTSDLDRANRALDQLSKKTPNTGKSVEGLADDFTKLQEEIDPTVKALNRLQQQQERLQTAFAKGGVNTQEYSRLNGIIESSRKRINDLGQTTGKTAKEINFALRGLPAQFTDIFVSLQGGQAPLTVFLQQGGQIKDMFGGVGPAFRAMGGYILGLINPLTIVTAALGALALGYYQGSKEADAFRLSLVSTGNAAGTSVTELQKMSQSVGEVTGNVGKAAAVLAQLANNTKIDVSSFERVAEVILGWSSTAGVAVEDLVQEFSKIAKDPIAGVEELNQKYNFLTAEIYNQIRALEAQGRTQDAAKVATDAFANALDERTTEMVTNLGYIEAGWKGIKNAVTGAWDAIKEVGRSSGDQLQDEINALQSRLELLQQGGPRGDRIANPAEVAAIQAQIKGLQDIRKSNEDLILSVNKRKAAEKETFTEGVSALKEIDSAYEESFSQRERINQRIAALDEKYNEARKAGLVTAEVENRYLEARAGYNKQLADLEEKLAKQSAPRQSAADKLLSTILQQGAALQNQLESQQKVLSEENKLAKLKMEIKLAEEDAAAGKATSDQRSIIANKEILLLEQQKNVATQKSIAAEQEKVRLKNLQVSLDAKLATNQQKYADRILGAGMGDTERERMRERLALQQEYNREIDKLTRSRNEGNIEQSEYEKSTEQFKANLAQQKEALEQNYRDMDAAQSNWLNGASRAWDNYLAEGRNVAGLTESFFTSAFSTIEDSLVSFVTTGKLSFKDLTVSILKDLASMATKIAANQILMSIIGSFGGGYTQAIGPATTSGYSVGSFQADGGAWNGGVQYFAKGGAFTNSIVSSPTAFGMQGGMGVMGEAGPEAIMPLTRTPDGQLGVQAAGGGSSVLAPVGVTVNISDSGGGADTSGNTNTESQGRAVQMAIKSEVEKTIQIGLQPGGNIWRAMNNR